MNFAMCTHDSYYCSFSELEDIYREDTIITFKEWLKVEGKLDDISNIPLLIVKQITILLQTSNYAS
jgi:hypothetical protein